MSEFVSFSAGAFSWTFSLVDLGAALVLLLAVGLAAVRAHHRLRSASPLRRNGVAALNVLAWFVCVLMLAPPLVERPAQTEVALITQGAASSPQATHSYTIGDLGLGELFDAEPIAAIGQLVLKHPDLNELAVSGHGLTAGEWSTLPSGLTVRWQPPLIEGLVDVHWHQRVRLGESVTVTGQLMAANTQALYTLQLLDPSGVAVDSVELRANDAFKLIAVPRSAGALAYRLQYVLNGQALADEPIAVWVDEPPLARLMVLQSAPSFETRQLSNWAADAGAPVIVRTEISRERDLVQRINVDPGPDAALSDAVLAQTDVLIVDGRRWLEFNANLRESILAAVEQGLGLLLWLDDSAAKWLNESDNNALFGARVSPDENDKPRWLQSSGAADSTPLPVVPWALTLDSAQPLTVDDSGAVLESVQRRGQGHLGLSRVRDRHRWATAGEQSVFARDWARLLSALGRADDAPRWLPLASPAEVRLGQRYPVCASLPTPVDSAQSADAVSTHGLSWRFVPVNAGRGMADSSNVTDVDVDVDGDGDIEARTNLPALALLPDPTGAPQACSYIWPAQAGWHRLALFNPSGELLDEKRVYVPTNVELQADLFKRRQQATREYQARSAGFTQTAQVKSPVSPWWAWGLLLLSLGPLWLERRLFDVE